MMWLYVFLLALCVHAEYFGPSLGTLSDGDNLLAKVWLVNETAIQLTDVDLTRGNTLSFAVFDDDVNDVKATNTIYVKRGQGFQAYVTPIRIADINTEGLVIIKIKDGIHSWKRFGIYDNERKEVISSIALNIQPPKPLCCIGGGGIVGKHYNVSTGPVTVLDSHTFLIPKFAFSGTQAPDGWLFAGNGRVTQRTGHKLQVEGRDEERHCALHEDYQGQTTLIARLPPSVSVYDISYLSLFCYQYDVDFGHIDIQLDPIDNPVPPYIPPIAQKFRTLSEECE